MFLLTRPSSESKASYISLRDLVVFAALEDM